MTDESWVKKYNYRIMQFLLIMLLILHVHFCKDFASSYHILVIFKGLGKFKLLENVCVDITLFKMERSIIKLRLSRYIGI